MQGQYAKAFLNVLKIKNIKGGAGVELCGHTVVVCTEQIKDRIGSSYWNLHRPLTPVPTDFRT